MDGNFNPICYFPRFRRFLEGSRIWIEGLRPFKAIDQRDIVFGQGDMGSVKTDENGMFMITDLDGTDRRVFLVRKEPESAEADREKRKPVAHLCMCAELESAKRAMYRYANNLPVKGLNRSFIRPTGTYNIKLCESCTEMLQGDFAGVKSIEDFIRVHTEADDAYYDRLAKSDEHWNGYSADWHVISEVYRRKKNFTCERCGIVLKDMTGHYFCHVHHKNGNKLDNDESNLECLCVECHSQVDGTHKEAFASKALQRVRDEFAKYRETHPGT